MQQTQPVPTPQVQQPAVSAAAVRAAPAPNQAPATWQGAVRAHLALFKRYPLIAQRRGEEGVAQVRFVMDHAGRVVSVALVGGSGHPDLDQEALAWIQRAQPFPVPPPEMGQGPVELLIPLRFELH
jgi:protein TonB